MVSNGNETIGQLIRAARYKWGGRGSQDALATKVGKSKQWLSGIEGDKNLPSIELLLKLHEELVSSDSTEKESILALWLLKWLESKVGSSVKIPQIQAIIERIARPSDHSATLRKPGQSLSLKDFPYAFEPLTIVCGDRREPNPKTRGDIFAHSLSTTDLTFLLQLGLRNDVTIRSDKLFVLMAEEYLKRQFGRTNLLVIGSPAVNFAARVINNYSIFRFDHPQWLKEWEQKLRSSKELNDRRNLEVFWQMAQHPNKFQSRESDLPTEQSELLEALVIRLLSGETAKSMMNEFRKPGLIDPADVALHAQSTRQDNDFAVISLARNPFADNDDYICIMVAGIHGPGTAHAIKALAEDDFRGHPLGGIIEIELDLYNLDWPTRFEKANWKWQTNEYKIESVITNLENALNQPKEQRRRAFANLTNEEIQNCIDFVRSRSDQSVS